MIFPTAIFQQRFSRQKYDFIENGHKYGFESKYIQSKFLRIWSDVMYSCGRLYTCKEIDWETTEVLEIRFEDVNQYFESLYLEWENVITCIKNQHEIMMQFRKI